MANYMENRLDMPLGDVLPIIQQGMMTCTSYFGIKAKKNPIDAWIYQEIIFEIKPDVIIEIGNANGGSTLFLAHLCDLLGAGRVIGLDVSHKAIADRVREHPRVTLIEGDACQSFEEAHKLIAEDERVLIIEDSSHTYANTLNVLRTYARLVKPGGYFIVEDSICHHGLAEGPDPGPYEAIEAFVAENADFEIDRSWERFLITWNPKGYLRRRATNDSRSHLRRPAGVTRSAARETLRLFVPPILAQIGKKLRAGR